MKCINCKKTISKDDTFCRFCGKENQNVKIVYKEIERKNNKWLIVTLGITVFLLLLESSFNIWYFFIKENNLNIEKQISSFDYSPNFTFNTYKVMEEFSFDNLEITIDKNYEILTLDNPYSIYNGKKIIKIPVTIKNISDKDYSLNLFYYDIYDSFGNLIDEVAGYFEEALYYAEDLKENEKYTKYIYALYYDNQKYIIKFENPKEETFVIYNIKTYD